MSESTADPDVSEVDIPEMPESKNSFQSWMLSIVAAFVVGGIGAGIGKATSDSGHFARLDTIIEGQARAQEEQKTSLKEIGLKIDALPKVETLAALSHRVEMVENLEAAQASELTRQAQLTSDNRHTASDQFESLDSKLKIYAARQWGMYNMDRWISQAEKKLGKPLPQVQDVTGKEPVQP